MRILVIKGQSQYGGTRLFADEAAAAFNRSGHRAEVLDLEPSDCCERDLQAAALRGPFDLVFSINILGDFRSLAGQTMAELLGCPHVVWHTDYVLASWDRLRGTPSGTRLLVVDPTQIDALRAAMGPALQDVRFFPHAAVGRPAPDDADLATFMARRPIPVLWSGGFAPVERPWSSGSPATQMVMDSAVDLALSVEWMPPHQALAQVLRAVGLDVSDPAKRHHLAGAWMVDAAVRVRRRQAFLFALAERGVELHVCGHGWEPHLHRFKNVTFHGAVEMTRMVELMRQSRIVLNTNGNFGAGSHERPLSAALAGAATFSDHSRFYAAEFRPGQDIELFTWMDLEGAMDRLEALRDDPRRAWEMARSAKQVTLAKHVWDRRIESILEAAKLPAAA